MLDTETVRKSTGLGRGLVADVKPGISAGALNFRDVMLAYGKLSRDLMAHGKGGDYIGLEFSGKVALCASQCMCHPPAPSNLNPHNGSNSLNSLKEAAIVRLAIYVL